MSTVATSTAIDREQLILRQMPQVRYLAAKIHRRCPREVLLEDLVSAGATGLIEAVDRDDPRRGVKLNTLAEFRIRGAILDYLRRLDPASRSVRRFQKDRDEAVSRLERQESNPPEASEIAAELGLPLTKYRRLDFMVRMAFPLSLDCTDHGDCSRTIPAVGAESMEEVLMKGRVAEAIKSLPQPERTVLEAVLLGSPIDDLARDLHVSNSRVSQIKSNGVRLVRIALGISSSRSIR